MVAAHRLQVRARAERAARPGQHADPDAGIAVGHVPCLAHQGHHRPAQRVARLRPVHRDDQDVPPALDERVGWPSTDVVRSGRGHAPFPHSGHPEALPKTVTRSTFFPMALNFADLFEHAAYVFAERTAVACGDRQVTYRELDERTNRLAHHLAELGVGPGDHVGLYARNSVEAVETLIASCKL